MQHSTVSIFLALYQMTTTIIFVIVICIIECVCDVLFKYWSQGPLQISHNLVIGISLYLVIGALYAMSLRSGLMSSVSSILHGLSLLLTFLLSVIYFKERPSKKTLCFIGLVFVGTIGLIVYDE